MNRETDLSPAVRQLIDTHFSGLRRTVRKSLSRLTCTFLQLARSVRFGYGGLHLTSNEVVNAAIPFQGRAAPVA
jgi:hypothetical protein